MEQKRVLVGCITSDTKAYCQDRFLEQLRLLTYQNKNIMFIDNSVTKDNTNRIVDAGFNCYYIQRKNKGVLDIMAESNETLRHLAVQNGFDYYFNIESDMSLSGNYDIVEQLMFHNRQVCSAIYDIGEGDKRQLGVYLIDSIGGLISPYLIGKEDINWVDGTVKDVWSCGIGAVLIHKSVLNKLYFRVEKGEGHFPDNYFAKDLAALGIPFYADTSLYLEHDNRDWGLISQL